MQSASARWAGSAPWRRRASKVKRLRNSPWARLAVCDLRGRVLGDRHDASAEILDDRADIHRALLLLRRKYGWQMWLADAGARLTGRFDQQAYLKERLEAADAAGT